MKNKSHIQSDVYMRNNPCFFNVFTWTSGPPFTNIDSLSNHMPSKMWGEITYPYPYF